MNRGPTRSANVPHPSNADTSYVVVLPRTFVLWRDYDVSGVSGTGLVAQGVEFADGAVVVRWVVGAHRSTVVWDSIEAVEAIHGHEGATRIVWDA